ncbi:MAG: helix-turn-helix domain-containing protein [Desulfovibrio sp.]|jgi:predicted XRE-type DNA-binding protein|nr:helix-turn-helix domain-containing protein [Desulfovibrio sp.]
MNENEMEVSSGNVYEDLGLENAAGMLIKAQLASTIQDIMDSRGLTQLHAADIMGLPQPKLSRLLSGQFRGVSEFKMLDCIARLGRDIHITIGPESALPCGRIEVLHVT